MSNILKRMVTSAQGGISSKIIIGSISYMILVVSLIVLSFIHPEFPGLSDLLSVLIITSGSLLGLTTVENVRNQKRNHDVPDDEEEINN